MKDSTDTINPLALKAVRGKLGMTQQQLADAIHDVAKGCTKDTVSRWERGKSQHVRSHLRKALCTVLQVKWEELTKPNYQPENIGSDAKTKVSIGKRVGTSLQLVAERYNVRTRDVLNLAPLLFLIVAERSLLERERRLKEIDAVLEEAEKKLLENRAHLDCNISDTVYDELQEEEDSLSKRDVFGRTINDNEGPFAHFIRHLTKDLPKDAVTYIDSFGSNMIEHYQIADDTLRKRTGIIEDEEQGQNLLHHIRSGSINFTECCRVKRDQDETGYRQWLSDELARAEQESKRRLSRLQEF